jgi:hypothetical protein
MERKPTTASAGAAREGTLAELRTTVVAVVNGRRGENHIKRRRQIDLGYDSLVRCGQNRARPSRTHGALGGNSATRVDGVLGRLHLANRQRKGRDRCIRAGQRTTVDAMAWVPARRMPFGTSRLTRRTRQRRVTSPAPFPLFRTIEASNFTSRHRRMKPQCRESCAAP